MRKEATNKAVHAAKGNDTDRATQFLEIQKLCNQSEEALAVISTLLSKENFPSPQYRNGAKVPGPPSSPALGPAIKPVEEVREHPAGYTIGPGRVVENHSIVEPSLVRMRLHLSSAYVRAFGRFTGMGKALLVEKGSQMRRTETGSASAGSAALRRKLIEDGVVRLQGEHYIFTQDHTFKTPSTASQVLLGQSSNGYTDWVTELGEPLGKSVPKS